MTTPTPTPTPTQTASRPFYVNEPCATCRREIGADGVWVTEEQKWCRRCARTLRGLLDALLGGQN